MLFFFTDHLTVNVGGFLGTVPATVPTARKQEKEMIKNHQQHATDFYREELAQEKQ